MSNPIESLLENNPAEFKSSVYDALFEKLALRLESAKVDVAAAMFGISEEVEDEDEDFEDEDLSEETDEDFEDEDFEEGDEFEEEE